MRPTILWGLLALLLVGCGGPQTPPHSVAVGATSSTESVLLANLYAAALRYYGTPAHVVELPDPLRALDSGEVTVVPGFTGQLLQTFAPGTRGAGDEQVYKAMVGVLPEGVGAGDFATAAEDKPAAVVTEGTATAWGGRDLPILVKHCTQIRAGALRGAVVPAAVGKCRLAPPREFGSSAELFEALSGGQINIAWATTADPDVPGTVVALADGKPSLIQAQNAVPLYRRNELTARQVLALNEVAGVLDTATLKQMRQQVDDGADPRAVADAWLVENPLGR
ncbi:hypothetical protein H7K00_18470 [Mycolicibacterium confluentis]|nr:glycine betaine ABC transporter substrate-binding protein [Mycolicibacterium confluentis]MCV7321204.1 hypothetical protein [Mycolicibacterium confluentis]